MLAQYLWLTGSVILLVLGTIHLLYTFLTNKFSPGSGKLEEEMKLSSPLLTKETSMWKAWIGFNASHSIGAMFIGIINFYLALNYFSLFKTDLFFFLFNILVIGFYVYLARKYWFRIPLTGIFIVLICFIISCILSILNK